MDINSITEESIADLILEDLGNDIQESIDSEVMYYLMMEFWQSQGWHGVELSKLQDNNHAVDITHWLEWQGLKDKDDYYRQGRKFVFRDSETATLFILKWC